MGNTSNKFSSRASVNIEKHVPFKFMEPFSPAPPPPPPAAATPALTLEPTRLRPFIDGCATHLLQELELLADADGYDMLPGGGLRLPVRSQSIDAPLFLDILPLQYGLYFYHNIRRIKGMKSVPAALALPLATGVTRVFERDGFIYQALLARSAPLPQVWQGPETAYLNAMHARVTRDLDTGSCAGVYFLHGRPDEPIVPSMPMILHGVMQLLIAG
ncbi:hypothetical protein JKP88DRAFT_240961 [Tribonema minus]|uniref:Uncharacterized protein n=1 Tax=Tribonema minus TaxID=303371 RepID=A0A835Z3J3_9STRA|nr:hypothetical protein JKP88DRAFT_255954 [Tribonema minus]KAG5186360.1 hypothetical protein JKP88DRAFT_240961 [Tribonema minus]